jgi:molybdate transport system regulatory protein
MPEVTGGHRCFDLIIRRGFLLSHATTSINTGPGPGAHCMPESTFKIRSKVWVENEAGKVVFGLGRFRILDTVDRLGSLQAAAKDLKMSYRAIWSRIRASEARIGKQLLISDNRGSRMTPFAKSLVKQFRRLQAIVEKESDEVYDSLMADRLSE